jgi:hypothetical protein
VIEIIYAKKIIPHNIEFQDIIVLQPSLHLNSKKSRIKIPNPPPGHLTKSNGDTYEGYWVSNKCEGAGSYFYEATGKVYVGEWADNMPVSGEEDNKSL